MKSYQDRLTDPPEKKKRKKEELKFYTDVFLFFFGVFGVFWYIWTDQHSIPILFLFATMFLGIKIYALRK